MSITERKTDERTRSVAVPSGGVGFAATAACLCSILVCAGRLRADSPPLSPGEGWVVPAVLNGPLDERLPAMCKVGKPKVAVSSRGAVGVAWTRTVNLDLFELTVHGEELLNDPDRQIPDAWRLKGTDRTYARIPRDAEVIAPDQRIGVGVITPDGTVMMAFLPSLLPFDGKLGVLDSITWYQGNLCLGFIEPEGVVVEYAPQSGAIRTLVLPHAKATLTRLWVLERRGMLDVVGAEYYRPSGELPDFLGGSQSLRLWSSSGDMEGLGRRTIVREVYLKNRNERSMDYQVVPAPSSRLGLLFQIGSGKSPFPQNTIFYQANLLAGSEVTKLGKNSANSVTQVVIKPDRHAVVVWLEEVERNRSFRLVATEQKPAGWSGPAVIAEGRDWSYSSLAVAAMSDGRVVAAWRGAGGALNCALRDQRGHWSAPIHTGLRIGSSNWLMPTGEHIVTLVSQMDDNLYWCNLTIPARSP